VLRNEAQRDMFVGLRKLSPAYNGAFSIPSARWVELTALLVATPSIFRCFVVKNGCCLNTKHRKIGGVANKNSKIADAQRGHLLSIYKKTNGYPINLNFSRCPVRYRLSINN